MGLCTLSRLGALETNKFVLNSAYMTVYNQALFKKDDAPNVGELDQGVETFQQWVCPMELQYLDK